MIKKDPLPAVLVAVLFICVLGTSILCYTYARSVKRLQGLQIEAAVVNKNRALLNSLAADVVEYSRRNPSIEPILQSVGLRPKGSPENTPAATPHQP